MIKYCLAPILLSTLLIIDWMGPTAVWIFFFGFSTFVIMGDTLFGNDRVEFQNGEKKFNSILYFILLLLFIKIFNFALLGMSYTQSFIFNLLSAEPLFSGWQRSYSNLDLLGIVLSSGLLIGGIGTVVGHELVHRKKNSLGFKVSNWLLALTWDPAFGIEHVHGHHKYVATYQDPESARRGESVYHFIGRSTWGTLRNAWKWEKERLAGKGFGTFSSHNQMLQVYLRSAIITGVVSLGGSISLVVYFGSVIWAKILLETVNYLEHYGLVRVPGTAIEPRHSWNSNHRISSYLLFNLTRHSAHHEKSNLPFWKMNPYSEAPMLPYGYLTMVYFILLIPWVYRRIMIRELKDWDDRFASREELELLSQYQ
jgi:alkane 1-monooxygenase